MNFLSPVRSKSFHGSDDFADLMDLVQGDEMFTKPVFISNMQQLLLRPQTGRTVTDNWQFSRVAFQQLCRIISGGLYRTLIDCYSKTESPSRQRQDTVIRVYNNLLNLRFSKLPRLRVFIDTRTREVVGVVSGSYQFVSNHDVLLHFAYGVKQKRLKFVEAKIQHREMFSLFERTDPPLHLRAIDWRTGVAAINSESSRLAIHVPQAVFDSKTGSFSLEPATKTNRIVHRKKKRFLEDLDGIISDSISRKEVGSLIQQSIRSPATWSRVRPSGKSDQWNRRFRQQLTDAGVASKLIDAVLEYAFGTKPGANRFDLYSAMLSVADMSFSGGRPLRFCAYRLMFPTKAQSK